MNTVQYRAIQRAWQTFDSHTALGCSQKGIPFDITVCKASWAQYNEVLARHNILPFPANYHDTPYTMETPS